MRACTIINHLESEREREKQKLMGRCQAPKWTAHLCSPNEGANLTVCRCTARAQASDKTSLPSKAQIIRIYTYGPRSFVGLGPYNTRSPKNLARATNRNGEEEHRGDTRGVQSGRQDNTSKDDPKCQVRNTTTCRWPS